MGIQLGAVPFDFFIDLGQDLGGLGPFLFQSRALIRFGLQPCQLGFGQGLQGGQSLGLHGLPPGVVGLAGLSAVGGDLVFGVSQGLEGLIVRIGVGFNQCGGGREGRLCGVAFCFGGQFRFYGGGQSALGLDELFVGGGQSELGVTEFL